MARGADQETGAAMMPCEHVMDRLWSFVDDELPAEESAAVQAHLEICGRCFPEYDWHRAYARFMNRVAKRMVAAGLRRRVFEALLEESRRRRD